MSENAASTAGGPPDEPTPVDLPLSEFQAGIEKCVAKLNGRVKHCGRNAFRHLRGAWTLFDVDKEMSAFRAITAEEEAAAALLLSLCARRYPGAQALNFRDHVQKAALTPFFEAVAKVLAGTDFAPKSLRLRPDENPPRLEVLIDLKGVGIAGDRPLFGQPNEPLNFVIHKLGPDGSRDVHMFEEELSAIARGNSLDEIKQLMRSEANLRNRLLYATDTGIPGISMQRGFLLERLRRVTVLLALVIAIQQTALHQLFAVQCLKAYLRALQKMEGEPFDFDQYNNTDVGIFIQKEVGFPATAHVVHYTFSGYTQRGTVTVDRVRFLPLLLTSPTAKP